MKYINNIFSDIPLLYYRNIKSELTLLYQISASKIQNELLLLYNKYNIKYLLTFDYWTASNQDEYLEITIYYINNKWKLISNLISMKNLKERHSAEYLLKILKNCLSDFEIQDKIFRYFFIINYKIFTNIYSITTDKASNNLSLLKIFKKDYQN